MKRNLLAVVLVIFFLVSPVIADAFGVSPPGVSLDKLVKGSRYEATVFLVRQDAKNELGVEAVFNMPEKVKSWISLEPASPLIIPANIQQFPVKIRVQVPPDADLGIYNGSITFNTRPVGKVGQEGQQIAIAIGTNLSLNLTVGEGIFVDFNIKNIDILDIKEGRPLQIVVTFENTGNVLVGADRATFDLFDKYGQVRLAFAQNENLPEVPAFETKTFTVEFPIDIKLSLGEYWGETKIYRGDTVIANTKTVFNVIEKKASWLIWILIFLGLLIVGSVIYFWRRRGRKTEMEQIKPLPAPAIEKKKTVKKKTAKKKKR